MLETLYKKTATGATQTWNIRVENHGTEGHAVIITEYGQLGGEIQTVKDVVTAGKNIGKKNETTPYEQAVAEAQAAWTKQRERKHYGLTVEESAEKRSVAPMLAHVYQDHVKKVDWRRTQYVQPKLDGHRCLAEWDGERVRLISRQGKEIAAVPHIIKYLTPKCRGWGETTLDGELYVHGVPLNTVGSWIKKLQDDSRRVQYHVYDLASSTRGGDMPFVRRRHVLCELMESEMQQPPDSPVQLVDTFAVSSEEEAIVKQAEFIAMGYEGAMLRHGDTPYEAGKRSSSLLKMKRFSDAEFRIVTVREGRGTHAGMAIFECETPEGAKFEVTAPGSHEAKRAFWERRVEVVGRQLTVKYAFMTKTENPVPFHPVAKCVVDFDPTIEPELCS